MKNLKHLSLCLLAFLMVLQFLPLSVFATTSENSSSVALQPITQAWVSARKPDVALSAASSTLRINGDAHDESFVLASFTSDQFVGKNRLKLSVPVVNPTGETIVVSVIDKYTVDTATVTYNSVKDKLTNAQTVGEYTLTGGNNQLDVSALLGMGLSDKFTLVLRSKAIGENDNVHSYFYDFQDYALSTNDPFFKNPGSNSLKIGYLDGTTTNSLLWRGANTDSNQNAIVIDPLDTAGQNHVLNNWIGGTHKSSGRLRPFDAMSHDKLTADDIGKTYRFSFRILITNDAGNATAKLSMGYAEASSTTFTMTLSNQALAQANGWQTYSVDYTVVADDIPAADAVTRTNGDRMFVFRIDGGTAEANVNWYIDDMSVVQLDENGDELCAVIGSDGIRIDAEFLDGTNPISTGYVSSALPSTKLGGHEQAVISGYSEDLAISYLSFPKTALGTGKYAVLELPGQVEGSMDVNVFLIDGYTVNEDDLDWDKRYTLENCPLIATGTLSENCKTLIFDNPVNSIEGDCFTLALCAKNSYSNYVNRIDFEDFEANDTITVNASSTDNTPYSSNFLFKSGGATGNFSAASVNGNTVAKFTTTASYNRFKIYNSFSKTAPTADDAGTYRLRFRVMTNANTSLKIGTMPPTGSTFYENSGNGTSYSITANTWTVIEHDITLTEAMITADPSYTMATVNFTKEGIRFYFDDFSISKLDENGAVTAPIARIVADDVTIRTIDVNQPLTDAYVAEDAPTVAYGNSQELILNTETGKNTIVAVSYLTEALRSNTILTLPATGKIGHVVSVVAVDGFKLDETTFTYEDAQALLQNAINVGRYTLGAEALEIDLQEIKESITQDTFTLLFMAQSPRSVLQTFESAVSGDILSATPPPFNRCYSDSFMVSVGGGGSTTANFTDIAGKDDTTSRAFHVNGYNRRYKFYNTISDTDITTADIGRTFRVTYDIMCTSSATVYTGLKCAINGNGTTTGPSGDGYEMNTYHTKTTVALTANTWQTVSFDVTIDRTIVDHQVGLVTIDFASGTTVRDYYVDNMAVTEIGGNTDGTTSTFMSREGNGAGFMLSGKGFVDTTEVTLDNQTVILGAEVTLLTPDIETSVTDIFRIVGSEKDYSLLSVENDSGKLFFKMNGMTYYLCDGKGVLYTANETPLSLTAIYNNTDGTVRYTVGEKLAYYTDGETSAVSFDLCLVEGGHVGQATASAFCQYSEIDVSITVSQIQADAPRLVGTQVNIVGDSIRVISGIDTLYYSKIGFVLESEGKKTLSWSNNYILKSVNALGETVTAEELGCQYLSCFILSDLDSAKTGDSVRITPTVYVGNQMIKGEPITLIFTVIDGIVSAKVDTTAPNLEGYRTYTMADAEGYYRPLGRVKTQGTSLVCDWSASGAEFVLDCEGDVFVTFDAQGCAGQYLTSFVDGVKCRDIVLAKGENTYTVAEGLKKGTHTVRIVAQYAKQTGNMNAIKFKGEIGTATLSDTYVEIIGDSITCGALLSPNNGNYATAAYSYVAMNALNSDYAICSKGGQALSVPSRASTFYKVFNSGRGTELYTPSRKADLIVVNLIVNDNWQWYKQNNNVVDETGTWSYENFDAGVAEFFETLESIHDMENTPILFVFGCNTTEKSKNFTALNRLKVLFDEIYYDKYDLKTVTLTGDASASDGGHPCAEAAQLQGEELTAFILENYPTIFPNSAQ